MTIQNRHLELELQQQQQQQQTRGALARALYTNNPDSKNELFFRKGDILTVIEYDYDGQPGWWLCALRGQRGMCPSNYLEILEDKYSVLPEKKKKYAANSNAFGENESEKAGEDPLETYDFPRQVGSCYDFPRSAAAPKRLFPQAISEEEAVNSPPPQQSESPEHIYCNEGVEETEPFYQNDGVDNTAIVEEESEFLTKSSPLDLYDVPRNELPIYGQSISRLRKYGSENDNHRSVRFNIPGRSQSTLGLSSSAAITTPSGVQLRRPPRYQPKQRSSVQSESAESGIGGMLAGEVDHQNSPQQQLYDVPRGTTGAGSSNVRPTSALSVTSSGMGLSIAASDSKDSLDDGLYDTPRNSSALVMKTYVNHMETKYDDVLAARSRSRHDSSGSACSFRSQQNGSRAHTRHNSTSSIFSAYGYTKRGPEPGSSRQSVSGGDPSDLYDVPRGSAHPPPRPSTRLSVNSSSNGSLNGASDDDNLPVYDVPQQFARKVSLQGSSSSIASSASAIQHNNRTSQTNSPPTSFLRRPSNGSLHKSTNGGSEVDVKLLPLGPKAAVSVCEKLRQEVVSSIGTILGHVKPKWRTKQNLTEIMPDLKFSCTRLCLAIKDVADFASRSLSNSKRFLTTDPSLSLRLHRLLTPVINGSQIIQRDVDELEAYFWSVDRLSVTGGDQAGSITASTSDALDQLILCSRSLKHDVTELANFLAVNSTQLYREGEHHYPPGKGEAPVGKVAAETKVEDTQEDYDYVSLVPTNSNTTDSSSRSNSVDSQKLSDQESISNSGSTSTVSWHLDPRDQQLLEFYSAQISVTTPQLSQAISTFIGAIQQNEPPAVFNIHLKYVILLGYKMLFAGDTVHRNVGCPMLKEEVELRANELHRSVLGLYEASKVSSKEFPKIGPMQEIVDRVWGLTQAATLMKKSIFNAVYNTAAV